VYQDVSGPDVPLVFTPQWDQDELAIGGRVPVHWGPPGAPSGKKKRKSREGLRNVGGDADGYDRSRSKSAKK
jgi:hypothetical protein